MPPKAAPQAASLSMAFLNRLEANRLGLGSIRVDSYAPSEHQRMISPEGLAQHIAEWGTLDGIERTSANVLSVMITYNGSGTPPSIPDLRQHFHIGSEADVPAEPPTDFTVHVLAGQHRMAVLKHAVCKALEEMTPNTVVTPEMVASHTEATWPADVYYNGMVNQSILPCNCPLNSAFFQGIDANPAELVAWLHSLNAEAKHIVSSPLDLVRCLGQFQGPHHTSPNTSILNLIKLINKPKAASFVVGYAHATFIPNLIKVARYHKLCHNLLSGGIQIPSMMGSGLIEVCIFISDFNTLN